MILNIDSNSKICEKGKLLEDTEIVHSYFPSYVSEDTVAVVTDIMAVSF